MSLYKWKSYLHVDVVLCMPVHCVCECVWFSKNVLSTTCFLEAFYEKKQAILTYEKKIATLQSQVEGLESTSAEKDIFIAKHEVMVKECQGEFR